MAAALRAVLAYEQELKTQVDDVQVSCRQIADVLNNNELQQEEDDGKLQFVPDIVKGLAQDAAETEGSIAVMMTALKAIEQRVKQVQTQKATAADDQEAPTDFEAIFNEELAKAKAAAATTDHTTADRYKKIMEYLPAVEDEDDDMMVVRNKTQDAAALLCPLTGSLFVEPVASKVCSHVFSKAAIMQHIKICAKDKRDCKCPVPGCGRIIASKDLEEHGPTVDALKLQALKVKEERRADSDDEEDEEEDEYTIQM